MATSPAAPGAIVEEGKMLSESLSTVKIQFQQMRRYLELDQLMDALKSASLMLAELRTSSLSPKQYYELYMAVFDALRHLSNYLYDAHVQGRHHLADLYELVQYAGNIVPRLYLMITVGSVYMSIPDAPVKEIMKDMMEMSRGVLHPIRGLFLRHYLSGLTRDHLPVGNDPGPTGNLQDSISFVLTNFIEMNKLWVRLQHQGHSRDREKRELERKELRILVGTNLVRLSQLDGVDLDMYQNDILPSILQQVVSCKDVIAQEYLMEVVIQVFTDEFHLHTLGQFLSATAQLHPKVNIKQIVIALIDRLAAYAAREAENEDPDETKRQEEAAARRLAEKVRVQKARLRQNGTTNGYAAIEEASDTAYSEAWATSTTNGTVVSDHDETEPSPSVEGTEETAVEKVDKGKEREKTPEAKEKEQPAVRKFRGVPEDVKLFEVFWQQVVELIKARPDLSIQDITALLVSLTNLSLSCYPDRLEYVDQILGFAHDKIKEYSDSPDLHSQQTISNLAALLVAPVNSYQSVLTLLALQQYSSLLQLQSFTTRRALAHALIASVLKNETVIETPEDVHGILDLCHVLVRDQADAAPAPRELAEEQGWVARMIHLFRSEALDTQFELLQAAREHFERGGDRMRYTLPALATAAIKLCRRYHTRATLEPEWETRVGAILKFIRQLISVLANTVDAPSIALRLFILAAQIADECGFEDMAYDLYVLAFTVFEESISESRAQLQAITLITGALQTAKVFSEENYDTLVTKAALHSARLLKKPHQAMAVGLASHLWWQEVPPDEEAPPKEPEKPVNGEEESKKAYPHQDGKRVLECLQKALRIANSATEDIITVQLYCDTLDQYLYYLDRGVAAVTPKFVTSLVDLIITSIDTVAAPDVHPSQRAPAGLLEGVQAPEMITRHFRNTLLYIDRRKTAAAAGDSGITAEQAARWEEVYIVGALLKMGINR